VVHVSRRSPGLVSTKTKKCSNVVGSHKILNDTWKIKNSWEVRHITFSSRYDYAVPAIVTTWRRAVVSENCTVPLLLQYDVCDASRIPPRLYAGHVAAAFPAPRRRSTINIVLIAVMTFWFSWDETAVINDSIILSFHRGPRGADLYLATGTVDIAITRRLEKINLALYSISLYYIRFGRIAPPPPLGRAQSLLF